MPVFGEHRLRGSVCSVSLVLVLAMRPSLPISAMLIVLAAAMSCCGSAVDSSSLWASTVQPLFDVQCVKCHGPIQQKGGLELDTPEMIGKGGDDGVVVVPGHPEKSSLFLHLAADADPHMPPKKQLTEAEREAVRAWIVAMGTAAAASNAPATEVMATHRSFPSLTSAIDTLIEEGWTKRGVQPAAPLDDAVWCRRVWLDLAGRIPTREEVDSFLKGPPELRRSDLVDRLLNSDEYPKRMRELWDVFLMGRPKRDNADQRRRDNGWWNFLEAAFRINRPWNLTVRQLLTARPTTPEERGASWFLYERRDNFQAIAEAVAPIVYGTKIDCAQCHDHPLAREIKQAHYWGLVAAFNRGKNVEGGSAVSESAIGGFINFVNLKKQSQPAVVLLLNGKLVSEARPGPDDKETDSADKYVDATASPKVPKLSRRAAFAEAATTDNPLLARAFVNRMWAALLGRGIVHPADEMNARNVPSHPQLLDWMAEDFISHGYDVRYFIRAVVLSRPYGLSPGTSVPEAFAAAVERPLTGEQLARSWRVAAGLPPEDDDLRHAVVSALPEVLPKDYNVSFQQAQFLSSSSTLNRLLQDRPGTTVARLTSLAGSEARIREAFSAVYGRPPDGSELAQATRFLDQMDGAPLDKTRDLLWALMTSAEFLTLP